MALPADLHTEDDEGSNIGRVEITEFRPHVIYPDAHITAGQPGVSVTARVLRTELLGEDHRRWLRSAGHLHQG